MVKIEEQKLQMARLRNAELTQKHEAIKSMVSTIM